MIHHLKEAMHVVAIDDRPHKRGDKKTELVFIFCAGRALDKFLHAEIDVDGLDATDVLIDTLSPHVNLFRIIITHGITVGGLNLLDLDKISSTLERPVIAVTENEPNGDALLDAITHVAHVDQRRDIIERAGSLVAAGTPAGETPVFFHVKGMDDELARQYLKKLSGRARLPECLLIAHKIASGL